MQDNGQCRAQNQLIHQLIELLFSQLLQYYNRRNTSVIKNINVLLQSNKNDVLNKVPFLFINSLNHIQAAVLLADLHLVLGCCVLEQVDQNIL